MIRRDRHYIITVVTAHDHATLPLVTRLENKVDKSGSEEKESDYSDDEYMEPNEEELVAKDEEIVAATEAKDVFDEMEPHPVRRQGTTRPFHAKTPPTESLGSSKSIIAFGVFTPIPSISIEMMNKASKEAKVKTMSKDVLITTKSEIEPITIRRLRKNVEEKMKNPLDVAAVTMEKGEGSSTPYDPIGTSTTQSFVHIIKLFGSPPESNAQEV
ncbi:hypothetical protein L6452_08812 [Arctium lappa]|uniref:Uncharacterized protein n=1 Tax=Arctium lappa TaxID=4217 RepID=A0ACB9DJE6_ARCLA|nr:hypothetical protein L6452_08812 [Arctium lappa]